MLDSIPTHLIAGPLGAGKTSLIQALLAQKPADERWAVLINEFGQIGLDAALLHRDDTGVSFAEVAGGCLCCVNGLPFQVGLGRLLRKARPDRLLIEPSGLGHPAQLLGQLRQPPWNQVLALQPSVVVLDAAALHRNEALAPQQREIAEQAGLLVLNKSETLDVNAREQLRMRLPRRPLCWTQHGQLALPQLPRSEASAIVEAPMPKLPSANAGPAGVWLDPWQPIVQVGSATESWSIGWRWHPSRRFDLERVAGWLVGLPWRRAKLVLHGEHGWASANTVGGEPLVFRPSEWRRDSRLELIFSEAQQKEALRDGLGGCLLD